MRDLLRRLGVSLRKLAILKHCMLSRTPANKLTIPSRQMSVICRLLLQYRRTKFR
jgi:hypothetical protein